MRRCGNDECANLSTAAFIISCGQNYVLFACDDLGPGEIPLIATSREISGIDERNILAMSIMDDYEMPNKWMSGLHTHMHPLLRRG